MLLSVHRDNLGVGEESKLSYEIASAYELLREKKPPEISGRLSLNGDSCEGTYLEFDELWMVTLPPPSWMGAAAVPA